MAITTYTIPAEKIVHNTSVDFSSRFSIINPIHIVQYDNSLPIISVELKNDNKTYVLPSNIEVWIRWKKQDNTFVRKQSLGCNSERNTVYFEITQQMVMQYGLFKPVVELIIPSDSSDPSVASSGYFSVLVDRNPIQNGDIESMTEYEDPYKTVCYTKEQVDNLLNLLGTKNFSFLYDAYGRIFSFSWDDDIKSSSFGNQNYTSNRYYVWLGKNVRSISSDALQNISNIISIRCENYEENVTFASEYDSISKTFGWNSNSEFYKLASISNLYNLYDEVINLINLVGAPKVVNSIAEMIDTRLSYVLASTGTIWKYKKITTTVVEETTEQIDGDIMDNTRLASDGTPVSGTGYAGYVTTPFIDLLSYPVPFTLHLDGGTFIPESRDSYTRICTYTDTKTKINCVNTTLAPIPLLNGVASVDDGGNASILFNETPKTNNGNNDGVLKYVRFSGKGISNAISLYTTYNSEVEKTVYQWVDTRIQYSEDTGDISEQVLAKISSLNNEGADPSSLTLLSQPVLDFYNSGDYPDNDYTITHLSKITYPCRADTPVPYTIKWAHNENAMRTTVAVDTKVIGTVNAYTMRTYDATGLDNYPIYNLLPNNTYYYKVTHILSDGSITEAKSGSFTTSSETIRLLNIDGTQNVRDLGGWIGLNGKKVKYGKLFRGASFSDSSYPGLMLTGKGRLALAELKITAELNLGAIDSETSIAANCDYYKIYYTNYATAITDSNARANFKTIFEKIVEWLSESSPRNVYMHCQGGCDRTGTLCFLLLGLLGVSESDLAKEYELSSFSDIGFGRLRTTTKAVDTYDYVGMVASLKTYSGDTITDKFVNFATTGCGISEETINSFRELMLD